MYLSIHMVMLVTFLLFRLVEGITFHIETKEIAKLIEEGKSQYNIIEQRSDIPQYGLCCK
jgi:hypothetical protein